MERMRGIGPRSSGWKPVIMPLYYTRFVERFMVGWYRVLEASRKYRLILDHLELASRRTDQIRDRLVQNTMECNAIVLPLDIVL